MNNKTVLGIFALAIIGLLGISAATAHGFGNFGFGQDLTDEEREEMQQNHDAMREAIENEDFETWKSLHEEMISQMQQGLTEENFNNLVEMHKERETFRLAMEEARESGDYSEVDALREELGINGGLGKGRHSMNGQGRMRFNK